MKITCILLLIILFCTSAIAFSGVYKHVDKQGNITYSNTPLKDATVADLPSITVVPAIDSEALDSIIKRRTESTRNTEQRNAIEQQITDELNRLEELKSEYKEGLPDRLGSERNYQRYIDRVERLEAEISKKEENLQKLKHNLKNFPDSDQ